MKNKLAKTKETSHGSKFVELLGMLLIGFAIVDFASSDKMITTASKYMKIFPILTRVEVYLNIPS